MSVALAYGVKALWMRSAWQAAHPGERFSWPAHVETRAFVAWDTVYYLPALGISFLACVLLAGLVWLVTVRHRRRRRHQRSSSPPSTRGYGQLGDEGRAVVVTVASDFESETSS